MLPKSFLGEVLHREQKRQLEIQITIKEILNNLKCNLSLKKEDINILEFGCGKGAQLPYLMELGDVIASDINISPEVNNIIGNKFVECSITDTPFENNQFDIIYSNHVIEHIEDLDKAFLELNRIGKKTCIYAFSVPTNIWLLLSIPAQYYNKINKVIELLFHSNTREKPHTPNLFVNPRDKNSKIIFILNQLFNYLLPKGHGCINDFINCYHSFKIKSWKRLFINNGFNVIKVKPLMIYGPSEWPIIETKFSKSTTCSSVLFLLKKQS